MRFGVLGPLAVWTDRDEPVPVPGRKVRALLADLLVHEGSPVSADRLVQDLWGEAAPADPTAALHVRVSQLRRALAGAEPGGRDLVGSQPPGYALRAGPDAVDSVRFTTLVGRARAAGDARTRAGL
ncbi:MAG: AfsR/SARP family transcriptional regulator, partial [Natronosporangium sp.]